MPDFREENLVYTEQVKVWTRGESLLISALAFSILFIYGSCFNFSRAGGPPFNIVNLVWTVPDSDRLPHACHACALPGELTAQTLG